jgi:hypothetical protein
MLLGLMILMGSAHAQQKPNIVFIFTNHFGYGELGVYGGGITRGGVTPRSDLRIHPGDGKRTGIEGHCRGRRI